MVLLLSAEPRLSNGISKFSSSSLDSVSEFFDVYYIRIDFDIFGGSGCVNGGH